MLNKFIKKFLYFICVLLLGGLFIFFILLIDGDINFELPVKTVYTTYNGNEYIKKTSKNVPSKISKQFDDIVVFNYNTMIYHEPWCEWAEECVDNCIYMERNEAKKYARHCYVCVTHIDDEESSSSEDYLEDSVPDRFQ